MYPRTRQCGPAPRALGERHRTLRAPRCASERPARPTGASPTPSRAAARFLSSTLRLGRCCPGRARFRIRLFRCQQQLHREPTRAVGRQVHLAALPRASRGTARLRHEDQIATDAANLSRSHRTSPSRHGPLRPDASRISRSAARMTLTVRECAPTLPHSGGRGHALSPTSSISSAKPQDLPRAAARLRPTTAWRASPRRRHARRRSAQEPVARRVAPVCGHGASRPGAGAWRIGHGNLQAGVASPIAVRRRAARAPARRLRQRPRRSGRRYWHPPRASAGGCMGWPRAPPSGRLVPTSERPRSLPRRSAG